MVINEMNKNKAKKSDWKCWVTSAVLDGWEEKASLRR